MTTSTVITHPTWCDADNCPASRDPYEMHRGVPRLVRADDDWGWHVTVRPAAYGDPQDPGRGYSTSFIEICAGEAGNYHQLVLQLSPAGAEQLLAELPEMLASIKTDDQAHPVGD